MFTKICFPVASFYFLESSSTPVLKGISYGEVTRTHDHPWIVLGLVLCVHLTAIAALLPQSQSLSLEPIPEPIMVSLLSAPQKPMSPAISTEKAQKPIKKQVKASVSKPVVPAIKQASLPVAPPAEQAPMPATPTSSPVVDQETKATNSKAADTQTYQSPNFNAAYLNNPPPDYPSISRRLGEQGLVLLSVLVTENGTAGSVELQTGSGSSRLDQAALEAVKKWRFIPAKRGEQPVSASVVVPVRFSIEG